MSKITKVVILLIVSAVVGFAAAITASGIGKEAAYAADIKATGIVTKLNATAYNSIAAPEIPATYYIDNVSECFEISFVVPADSLYPTIDARQRITKVTSNECREAKGAGKLVVYPDDGPDAQIADLK